MTFVPPHITKDTPVELSSSRTGGSASQHNPEGLYAESLPTWMMTRRNGPRNPFIPSSSSSFLYSSFLRDSNPTALPLLPRTLYTFSAPTRCSTRTTSNSINYASCTDGDGQDSDTAAVRLVRETELARILQIVESALELVAAAASEDFEVSGMWFQQHDPSRDDDGGEEEAPATGADPFLFAAPPIRITGSTSASSSRQRLPYRDRRPPQNNNHGRMTTNTSRAGGPGRDHATTDCLVPSNNKKGGGGNRCHDDAEEQ